LVFAYRIGRRVVVRQEPHPPGQQTLGEKCTAPGAGGEPQKIYSWMIEMGAIGDV
jgi:hypothetical protein